MQVYSLEAVEGVDDAHIGEDCWSSKNRNELKETSDKGEIADQEEASEGVEHPC